MLNINKTRKDIGNHLKVLTGSLFRNNGNGGNLLQLEVSDSKLYTASLGVRHTLVLKEDLGTNVLDNTGQNAVDPLRLSKVLPYMGDELSLRIDDNSVEFYNNDSEVKLYKQSLQDDYKVNLEEVKTDIATVKENGVELDKEEFLTVIRRLMNASGDVEDIELYNIVQLNFRDNGKAFTGGTLSYFRTEFDLEGLELVIDKGTATLISSLGDSDDDKIYVYKDGERNKVYYVTGENLLKVEGIEKQVMRNEKLDVFENLPKDNKLHIDLNTFIRQVKLATTLAEDEVVDIIIEDGKGEIRSGVGGNLTDFSKGEFNADEDVNLAVTVESGALLDTLGVITNEINLYISDFGNNKVLLVESADGKDYGVVSVTDIS